MERARWFSAAKNQDVRTGPLARPLARWLTQLTRSLAPAFRCAHLVARTAISLDLELGQYNL